MTPRVSLTENPVRPWSTLFGKSGSYLLSLPPQREPEGPEPSQTTPHDKGGKEGNRTGSQNSYSLFILPVCQTESLGCLVTPSVCICTWETVSLYSRDLPTVPDPHHPCVSSFEVSSTVTCLRITFLSKRSIRSFSPPVSHTVPDLHIFPSHTNLSTSWTRVGPSFPPRPGWSWDLRFKSGTRPNHES